MRVSVIGSQPGECVVVEMTDGSCIILDCCKSKGINHTIEFLEAEAIKPARVTHLVFTHFHDDHIKGAAELAALCADARIVLPDAWSSAEFKHFVASFDPSVTFASNYVTREVTALFDEIQKQPERLFLASELVTLFPGPGGTGNERLQVLTPFNSRKIEFLASLGAALQNGQPAATDYYINNKNMTSISCLASAANLSIFLAGDLENPAASPDLDVLHSTHLRHIGKYDLVKFPHHGSNTSFCSALRAAISDDDTVVAITPMSTKAGMLPGADALSHLRTANQVWVLKGERIAEDRVYRLSPLANALHAVPRYRPGILTYSDGGVSTTRCVALSEFASE